MDGVALLVVSVPPTDPPITLPDGKLVTECVSSNPKPGCGTRDTDAHQVAVLGVLVLAIAFIGWRIARGIRRRPAAAAGPER